MLWIRNGNGAGEDREIRFESDGPGHFSRILIGEMPEATDDRREYMKNNKIRKNRSHGE